MILNTIRNSLIYRGQQRLYRHLLMCYDTKTPLTRQLTLLQTFLLTPNMKVAVDPSAERQSTNFTYVVRLTHAYL